jgi:DNA repair protein RadC
MIDIDQVSEISISYKPKIAKRPLVKSSNDCYQVIKNWFDENTIQLQEQFVVMYLNQGNRVLGMLKLSTGGITGTVADVRLILAVALKAAACSITIAHNHHSGNPQPSKADLDITRKIKAASDLMDIRLLDHLILTSDNEYLRLADERHV